MKEVALIATVLMLALLSAYMINRFKGDKVKSKEAVSMEQPTAKVTRVEDYYYSAQIVQYWNKLNRTCGSEKLTINKVNGIAYTERVPHGSKPTFNVTDSVLVASGVVGDGLTVEYTNVAW